MTVGHVGSAENGRFTLPVLILVHDRPRRRSRRIPPVSQTDKSIRERRNPPECSGGQILTKRFNDIKEDDRAVGGKS
jgi:hypothetical protein